MRIGLAALWAISACGLACGSDEATVHGTVTDASGSSVMGAVVRLETAAEGQRVTVTDEAGAFHFDAVAPGNYKITIADSGFADWTAADLLVRAGESPAPVTAVLQVAPASTKVDVGLTPHELATEQIKAEEKQRLFGVFPDYFVSYEPNAAPLSAAQKFELGWKTVVDPVTIASSVIVAGIEQARSSYHQFGQGMEGYGKRFGADYVDNVNGVIIGGVLMQMVFHQDPRYFYKGTGTVRHRFLYAIATAFVCKGDNGHWQPDFSDVLGGLAAGEISTLYYPASSRTGLRLFHNVLLGFGGRAAGNLAQEFLFRKVTTHVPKTAATVIHPVLTEGTPVSLISVEDLGAKKAGPVDFVVAHDVEVGGAVVAKAGTKGTGEVTTIGGNGGAPAEVRLKDVRLKVGNAEVPLRSTPKRGESGALEYRRVEGSGRIAVTLYVAGNVGVQ